MSHPREEQRRTGDDAEQDATSTVIRRYVGLGLGILLAVVVYHVLPDTLAHEARATAAVGTVMAIWWMTEAIPIPATALLPLVLFPALGVVPIGTSADEGSDVGAVVLGAAAPYADKIIFLFMGGFMLAFAMQRWGLHRRIALRTVLVVGTKPVMLIAGFMIATAFLSMWVSNTATTVMMLPIGLSVLVLVGKLGSDVTDSDATDSDVTDSDATDSNGAEGERGDPNFSTALMLGIAYAASIGSLGTIIGTPPNGILVANLENQGIQIGFGQWMLFGVPIAVVFLAIAWVTLTRFIFPPRIKELPGGRELIHKQVVELGPISRGEWTVLIVFVSAALSWVFIPTLTREIEGLGETWLAEVSDEVIAVCVALALFIIPVDTRAGVRVLDWETAKKIPWGVLLLFGGGLSLANQIDNSGLGEWIGEQVTGIGAIPIAGLIVLVAGLVLLLTELTSNTATAATFIPILIATAIGLGIDPMMLAVPAALAATAAFMLPVATPPNAIAFGSGYVRMSQMIRAGIWLNMIGVVLITAAMFSVAQWALGVSF